MTSVTLENGIVTCYSKAKVEEVIQKNCIVFGKFVFL